MELPFLLRRILRAGCPESASVQDIEHVVTRNGTLLALAVVGSLAGIAVGLQGSAFHSAMALSSGMAGVVGLVLCARGRARLGVFVALLATNVIVTLGVTAEGAGHLAVLHIMAVCVPFSLFHARDRVPLLAGVAMAALGMCISTIPLVPTPWLAAPDHERDGMRAVASIGILTIIATQLWLFVASRNRMLGQLSTALDQANAASYAKSAFLANMSHEIRTPINGVLGMIGVLEGTKLDPLQQEYLHTARTSGLALLDVINDILDLSKVEAGQLRLEPVPFELRATLEDILDQFALQTSSQGLELVLRYVPDTPEHVVADAGRVRQVVNNLLSNAIKFTERGHVLVTVTSESVSTERAVLRLSVEDTGVGIAPEHVACIFDEFRQIDGSATRQHAGTGLGLTISRALVHLMGGEIGVESTLGQGSTFWVTLPMELTQGISVLRSSSRELALARVLIVDDHPVNRRVLREQLTSWQMHNEDCDSGAAALLRLRQAAERGEPYALAVLDYQMPQMDGLALARAIKAEPALAGTILILLTSVTLQLDTDELKAAGFAGYLVKPVHHSELRDVLAAALHAHAEPAPGPLITRHLLQEHPREDPGAGPYQGLRVLVVDDNAINQKVAAKLLERLGCRVDVAGNGREALELLGGLGGEPTGAVPYDAVFMDVQMPVMDGLEATRALRACGVAVPVIAMTAHAMQGDRERCLAAGMSGYVSKPVQRETLAREPAKLINPTR